MTIVSYNLKLGIKNTGRCPDDDAEVDTMSKQKSFSGMQRIRAAAAAAVLGTAMTAAAAAPVLPVNAAGSVEMSTSYPGVAVKPGDNVSFTLDFQNDSSSGEEVNLSQSGLPEGWTGVFEGNGRQISAVYAKAGANDGLATYSVTVPQDAKNGNYSVVLRGDSSALKLTMTVTDEDTGDSSLTVDHDKQQGVSGTALTYNITLQNSTSSSKSYALSAEAPKGWTVTFKTTDANNITSADVDAHSSEQVTVTATAPKDAKADSYTIPVTAEADGQKLSTKLTAAVTGTYDTQLTTADGTLSFTAGANHRKAVTLTVVNNGNLDLSGINLSANAPSDWTVEFSQDTIDSIPAGQTKSVTMYVTPSKNAISGDYTMDVTASNQETSVDNTFRVTVKTGTAWGIAGVVIIAAVLAALAAVFRKFGRH